MGFFVNPFFPGNFFIVVLYLLSTLNHPNFESNQADNFVISPHLPAHISTAVLSTFLVPDWKTDHTCQVPNGAQIPAQKCS